MKTIKNHLNFISCSPVLLSKRKKQFSCQKEKSSSPVKLFNQTMKTIL